MVVELVEILTDTARYFQLVTLSVPELVTVLARLLFKAFTETHRLS
jgi:hypothetical protein